MLTSDALVTNLEAIIDAMLEDRVSDAISACRRLIGHVERDAPDDGHFDPDEGMGGCPTHGAASVFLGLEVPPGSKVTIDVPCEHGNTPGG
jgi:hypothetical protein